MGNPSKRHPRYLFRDQMSVFLEAPWAPKKAAEEDPRPEEKAKEEEKREAAIADAEVAP